MQNALFHPKKSRMQNVSFDMKVSYVKQVYMSSDGIYLHPALQVETASPLRNARRKGRPKNESKNNASVEMCSAGSCEKNNLEEQTESLDNNDAAKMDWEEGHVEHIEYSDEFRETITVEFNDVPSSTNKKSVRRPTAEEKVNFF